MGNPLWILCVCYKHKNVEKLIKNQEQNMTNKVNIEFLKSQLEKALNDVEQLKDKVRANGTSH